MYGVIIFRNTGLDNDGHLHFAGQLGDLEINPSWGGSERMGTPYLFDISNVDADGNIVKKGTVSDHFHTVDGLTLTPDSGAGRIRWVTPYGIRTRLLISTEQNIPCSCHMLYRRWAGAIRAFQTPDGRFATCQRRRSRP